ncbi:hypothetical protein JCGZ_07953 [Jatropha curcas]|uniref:Uncharacterized protein n=1 Tax=Jatropha curcas TaxID=180498 RepID=A0A067KMF9_JATCU|nr:hypothetical protein JCGZ_07953 [Jatropha curcas]
MVMICSTPWKESYIGNHRKPSFRVKISIGAPAKRVSGEAIQRGLEAKQEG